MSIETDTLFTETNFDQGDWPQREGESGFERLIKDVQAAVDLDKSERIRALTIFMKLSGAKELHPETKEIFNFCEKRFYYFMQKWENENKPIDKKFIKKLAERIVEEASSLHKTRFKGRRYQENAILYILYIIQERVVRVKPNGNVVKPGLISPALEITNSHLKKNAFKGIVDFVQKARNRKLLETVYKDRMAERFRKVNVPENAIEAYGKQLIDRIINDVSIDIVRGVTAIGNGTMAAHTRHGQIPEQGPGIWLGEHFLRELSNEKSNQFLSTHKRPSNLEFLAETLLEEAQHIDMPIGAKHRKLEVTEDFKTYVHHDDGYVATNAFSHIPVNQEALEKYLIENEFINKVRAVKRLFVILRKPSELNLPGEFKKYEEEIFEVLYQSHIYGWGYCMSQLTWIIEDKLEAKRQADSGESLSLTEYSRESEISGF